MALSGLKAMPAATYSVTDNLLTVTSLLPLGTGEAMTLKVTDADGVVTSHAMPDGKIDLAVLAPGSYALQILKTRTTTSGTVGNKWFGATPQITDFYKFSGGSNITIVRPTPLGGSYSLIPPR